MFKKVRLGTVFLLALLFGIAITEPVSAQENLGNFPDAIDISAEFTTVMIAGMADPVPGFLFHLTNTSYDAVTGHASFDRDPDGDFAVRDVLTPTAGAAIAAAQPFGIYSFGALLPDGSGAATFAPDGFLVHSNSPVLVTDVVTGMAISMREINFAINLKNPTGLIFDADAPSIPGIFTIPEFGPVDFFISTPDGFTPDQLPQVRNDPGIDISTQMAWAEIKSGVQTVQTKFKFNGRRLRPRGELMPEEAAPAPIPQ